MPNASSSLLVAGPKARPPNLPFMVIVQIAIAIEYGPFAMDLPRTHGVFPIFHRFEGMFNLKENKPSNPPHNWIG